MDANIAALNATQNREFIKEKEFHLMIKKRNWNLFPVPLLISHFILFYESTFFLHEDL